MICVKNVTKTFGDLVVLENLSCTVKNGSIYGLIGHNGAGKTTLLKVIAGIYRTDAGKVFIDGQDVFDHEQVKQNVFFVPDEHYFLPQATMNTMAAFYKGFYPNWSDHTYKRLTEIFGLDPAKKLNGFSRGMQQQAAIILALSTRPGYLLFDECFDGLDPVKRSLLRQLITEIIAEKEVSVLISSHNIRELEDLCDSIGVIHQNHIIYSTSIDKISERINKYRVALKQGILTDTFEHLCPKKLTVDGQVATFIAAGPPAVIEEQLKTMEPLLVQVIPLTLEELFLTELVSLWYSHIQ